MTKNICLPLDQSKEGHYWHINPYGNYIAMWVIDNTPTGVKRYWIIDGGRFRPHELIDSKCGERIPTNEELTEMKKNLRTIVKLTKN